MYVHVFYNAQRAATNYDAFTRKLLALKKELETGQLIEANEKLYQRYFIVKQTPKLGRKVEFADQQIQQDRKRYSGFFCIISNKIKDAEQALCVYRGKDIVENCFDDLKNQLDMKRLRVHAAEAMDARLFLQFLALIYVSEIRQTTKKHEQLKYLTVRDVMEQMETILQIKCSGRYGQVLTEISPPQHKILKAFGVVLYHFNF